MGRLQKVTKSMIRRIANLRQITQAILAIAVAVPLAAQADTITVPKDANTIQDAINLAQGDDVVLVSPGQYNEAINFNGKAITLKSIDGASVTVLDGWQLGDSVVKCISGEGPSTILDGFTITGGTGNKDLYSEDETVGGGLLCLHSSPTILNCIFVSNESTYQGGAIFNGDRSNTSIQNCKIRSNTSERGGGIYNSRGRPVISNAVISDNVAMFNGNAVYRGYRSATVLDDNCRFTMVHDTISGTGGYMVARGRQFGACCIGTGCLIVDEDACVKAGGSWLGANSSCEDQMLVCPKPNTGDVNTDGVVDMLDLVLVMTSMDNTSKN